MLADDLATRPVLSVTPEDTLHTALRRMTELNIDEIPVVQPDDSDPADRPPEPPRADLRLHGADPGAPIADNTGTTRGVLIVGVSNRRSQCRGASAAARGSIEMLPLCVSSFRSTSADAAEPTRPASRLLPALPLAA